MIRLLALWAVFLAAFLLAVMIREDRLTARGKIPMGRLRRLWFRTERRRAPRYRVNWGIRYSRQEGRGPARQEGSTRDVSQTGAGLTVQEKLPVGSFLDMELALPESSSSLCVRAEVMWTKEMPLPEPSPPEEGRTFFVGIRFQGIDPELEQRLRKALGDGRPL